MRFVRPVKEPTVRTGHIFETLVLAGGEVWLYGSTLRSPRPRKAGPQSPVPASSVVPHAAPLLDAAERKFVVSMKAVVGRSRQKLYE